MQAFTEKEQNMVSRTHRDCHRSFEFLTISTNAQNLDHRQKVWSPSYPAKTPLHHIFL